MPVRRWQCISAQNKSCIYFVNYNLFVCLRLPYVTLILFVWDYLTYICMRLPYVTYICLRLPYVTYICLKNILLIFLLLIFVWKYM